MKLLDFLLILIIPILITSCSEKEIKIMELSSDSFTNGALIPSEYSCEGDDLSPPIIWNNIPEKVKSYALTCVDPDAPMGDWIHWVAWNIPADLNALPKGIDPIDQSQFAQGTNSWGKTGYGGPCPPRGHGPHRYYFTLHALDTELTLDTTAQLNNLLDAIEGHILGKAVILGQYERK